MHGTIKIKIFFLSMNLFLGQGANVSVDFT